MRSALINLALILIIALPSSAHSAKVLKSSGANGAIALQRETGAVGYSYDQPSSRAAKLEALKQCGDEKCEVLVSFRNACGAIARGTTKYFSATGATRQEAETKAQRLCGAKTCEIASWACTK
jgi:hypothetical protein